LEHENGPLNAYVNNAHGDETEEDWYGHERWRIHRLTGLKKKYDPNNRLVYDAPIKAYLVIMWYFNIYIRLR
jgi:hypothetical protein